MAKYTKLSIFLSRVLRHRPEDIEVDMDIHGYVSVDQLIQQINQMSKFTIDKDILDEIVRTDDKQRYKYSDDGLFIKACQGHSIPWVIPELVYKAPPDILYHGTTLEAYQKIIQTGYISKMKRHAVHMQPTLDKSWQSARRWHQSAIVIVIDAIRMYHDGYEFGESDNHVWCCERVPVQYIIKIIEDDK